MQMPCFNTSTLVCMQFIVHVPFSHCPIIECRSLPSVQHPVKVVCPPPLLAVGCIVPGIAVVNSQLRKFNVRVF